MRASRVVLILLVVAALIGACAYAFVHGHGFDARVQPGGLETSVALRLRSMAIPREARERVNPEPLTDANLRSGLEHFADHCSVCHGNDGSGAGLFGPGLYPKPPDMRLARTQGLTDGELFYIIERGVPLTGMPGFGTGTADGELGSWHLVQFIRRLPHLTDEELAAMAELTPRSKAEWQQWIEEQEFLQGGDSLGTPAPMPAHGHKGDGQ